MKEISKALFAAGVFMSLFSCKTVKVVSFCNEDFERFKESSVGKSPNSYYFRMTVLTYVGLLFFDFSNSHESNALKIDCFSIFDDARELVFSKKNFNVNSIGKVHNIKEHSYKIYSIELDREELNHFYLENYDTKYFMVIYEIDGNQYAEKLMRQEETQFLWRT